MNIVTFNDSVGGIGPFKYNGYNYYVSPASKRIKSSWGKRGVYSEANSRVSGESNTKILLGSDTHQNPIVNHALNLGQGWFIPSTSELDAVIFRNSITIDKHDLTKGVSLESIEGENVWSSTESNQNNAWNQKFTGSGIFYGDSKKEEHWVIALKRFKL